MRSSVMLYGVLVLSISIAAAAAATAIATVGGSTGQNVDPVESPSSSSSRYRIHHGWEACRIYRKEEEEAAEAVEAEECWKVPSLPTTALMVLLEHNITHTNSTTTIRPDNIYFSNNLDKALPDISNVGRNYYTLQYKWKVPPLPSSVSSSSSLSDYYYTPRQILRFHGINYRAMAYWNQQLLPEIGTTRTTSSSSQDGMFRRRHYDITTAVTAATVAAATATATATAGVTTTTAVIASTPSTNEENDVVDKAKEEGIESRVFHIVIEPPLNPGIPNGEQGGNHVLAKDGPTAQFMLGWDWVRPMPDRSTGFFGAVEMHTTKGPLAILDPAIQTLEIECTTATIGNANDESCTSVVVSIQAQIECGGASCQTLIKNQQKNTTSIVLTVTSDWDEVWTLDVILEEDDDVDDTAGSYSRGTTFDVQSLPITVQHPDLVHLWWPNGLSSVADDEDYDAVDASSTRGAYLHSFRFDIMIIDQQEIPTMREMKQKRKVDASNTNTTDTDTDTTHRRSSLVSDSTTIRTGIRTIDTYFDEATQGQIFKVNQQPIYIVGGNWITTDSAFRYSASKKRYCDELELFRYTGFNLVRVWGGGVTETVDFYECADELGLLVYQEFWMTGDNNGRWAGNFSWPSNYDTYLSNVQDTVRRLRRHPSLLFYGGGNELLAPRGQSNPPMAINNGIRDAIQKYDHPNRFYIPSSMGGSNRSYSLAYADGPYLMLMPNSYFERNPGLPASYARIGFQPEIGGPSAPTYNGLIRFMSEEEADRGFPRRSERNNSGILPANTYNDAWGYHKYLSWKTNGTYDHVYAYLDDNNDGSSFANASEWCMAAQLAAHKQYQNMFEGFTSRMFDYTSAVILWKAQSPWPSFRGFLYDWYLESTGTLYGVRAALHQIVSVALDQPSWKIRIINRSRKALFDNDSLIINYQWISIDGVLVKNGSIPLSHAGQENHRVVPSMSSVHVSNTSDDGLGWPKSCTDVCFLQINATSHHGMAVPNKWYWLPDPRLELGNEFAALGRMRSRQKANVSVQIRNCLLSDRITVTVSITVSSESSEPLFYPTFSLYSRSTEGSQELPILPLFDTGISEVLLLPGSHDRILTSTNTPTDDYNIRVVMDSWNGGIIERNIHCVAADVATTKPTDEPTALLTTFPTTTHPTTNPTKKSQARTIAYLHRLTLLLMITIFVL